MESITEQWDFLQRLMDMLEHQFGTNSEIILHDLTKDYAHTIVDIRNGYITGRKIGDCGSNLGLEVLRGSAKDSDRYNYVVHTPEGKILRSSTMFFKNSAGVPVGTLCINTDITQTVALEGFLHRHNAYLPETPPTREVFAGNIAEVLEFLIEQAAQQVGKPVREMTRAEKMHFLALLDEKGAFLVTKSADRVCEFLGVSRFTLYNYLDAVRTEKTEKIQQGEAEQ